MRGSIKGRTGNRGFSLMELLVVIAIIAVLAGLIFPMAGAMRERGNQSACIGNLQSIGQALKLYRLDEREYPPALYGWLEEGASEPTTFLYPHYARSRREFKCPDNPNRFDETQVAGPFSGTSGVAAGPVKKVAKQGGGYDVKSLWYPDPPRAIVYYLFDSYDGAVMPPNKKVNGYTTSNPLTPISGNPHYEQHFRRDWAFLWSGSPQDWLERNLLHRNPEDSTFVTACTYHRHYNADGSLPTGNRSLDMVLFMDGHTEKMPSAEINMQGWMAIPKDVSAGG